jgi:hypothetical protein
MACSTCVTSQNLKGIKKFAHEIITIISCIIITLCIQNSPKAGLAFPSSQNPSLQSFKQTGEFNLQSSTVDLNQFEVFLQSLQKENRRKSKRKGKRGKRPRETIWPEARTGPWPNSPRSRSGTLLLSLTLTNGPHPSA